MRLRNRPRTSTAQPNSSTPRPEWLCVLELLDRGAARRCPHLPHVEVTRTLTPPGVELDARIKSDKKWMAKGVRRVRYDLMPEDREPGGRLTPFLMPCNATAARKAVTRLRDELQAKGYTVNGNTTVWRLYVIELRPRGSATGDTIQPYVYVGQTSIPLEVRARQHRLGPAFSPGYDKYSRICHKHYKQLRLELLPRWARQTFYSRCYALRAEGKLRLHFESEGYRVEGGNDLLGNKPHECGKLRR
ncbi:MAG: hypothetical protein O2788_05600 [Chloroflexi bacterium]|nr:hypothetical protein [Chloroflexota bacterium]